MVIFSLLIIIIIGFELVMVTILIYVTTLYIPTYRLLDVSVINKKIVIVICVIYYGCMN